MKSTIKEIEKKRKYSKKNIDIEIYVVYSWCVSHIHGQREKKNYYWRKI